MLLMAKVMTMSFWRWRCDPDSCTLPYLTSIGDVIGTVLLVIGFKLIN
jgi:solute carrier family 41